MESRWLRWIGPGVIALGAVGLIASTALGAGQPPWTPRACGGDTTEVIAAAGYAWPRGLGDLRLEAWFRLEPSLDRDGAVQGQRLALGTAGDRSSRIMDLPPESFAAGPFGRIVLVGTDDGTTSRLEAVNVAAGCSWALAEETAVIRRATIDPAGETIYETRVDRATRADLGVWVRALDGATPARRILDPLGADDRFGRTFSTEFAWDVSGGKLGVQSCGESACRTRVIDPANGATRTIAEPDLGTMIGLDGDLLVTYTACPGLPCPIAAIDLQTGSRQILVDAGAVAVVISTPDGPRLVHEILDDAGLALRSIALDGSSVVELGRLSDGLRLHPTVDRAEAATRLPSGWALLAVDGRIPADGPANRTELRHVPDGTAVQLDEVTR